MERDTTVAKQLLRTRKGRLLILELCMNISRFLHRGALASTFYWDMVDCRYSILDRRRGDKMQYERIFKESNQHNTRALAGMI
jgi:hypothetical protein